MGFYEPGWDDLRAPASAINPPGGVSDPTRDTVTPGLLFSAGSDEIVHIIMQMPHSWLEGSEIRPHVHWAPTNTNTGSVVWQLEYQVVGIGDAIGSWSTLSVTDPADGTDGKHQLASFSGISMTGHTLSTILLCRLSRLGTDGADTYNDDARLLEFDIHYQIDGLGSIQEFIKNGP